MHPRDVAASYAHAITRLETCCSRVEILHVSGKIAVTEVELIYESAFLNAVARLESLLGSLLEEFVCGLHTARTGNYPTLKVRSRGVYQGILLGTQDYVDLLPYARCIEIAKRFLNEGRPFSDVGENDKRLLSQAVLIRNAIAHRSDAAMVKFRTKVPGVENLYAHRRLPGALLRRVYRAHPDETWNNLYLATFRKVGHDLAHGW